MAAETFYSAQTLPAGNPLRPAGIANLALGALKLVCGLALLLPEAAVLRQLLGTAGADTMLAVVVALTGAAVGLVLGVAGVQQVIRGVGQVSRMIVPPRAPADFKDYEAEVATALQRREMPAYRLPEREEYALAHRLFPHRFPMLNERQRAQLGAAVSSVGSTSMLAIGVGAALWAAGLAPTAVPRVVVPSYPIVVMAALLLGAAARVTFALVNLPVWAPSAERGEFRLSLSGGGDPKQIPIGLEHELLAFRPASGAPNRGGAHGFGMTGGGVQDAGEYAGSIVVETQPQIGSAGAVKHLVALFIPAALLTGTGLFLCCVQPGYVKELAQLTGPSSLAGLYLVRWALRLIGAQLLISAARSAMRQAEAFLNVFRYTSTAVAVRVQGTYGRAGVKVGKGIHDSIESENVVVRSDSSVVGYVARIESESVGIMGPRYIVAMVDDGTSVQVLELVESWFERFQTRGADIVGITLQSEKLASIVAANVGIDAQRAAAKQAATMPPPLPGAKQPPDATLLPTTAAAGAHLLPPTAVKADAAAVPPPLSQALKPDEKLCPDCAEVIKAAARKCRFCGYRFDSNGVQASDNDVSEVPPGS